MTYRHWEEKDKLDWSKQRLAELLEGLTINKGLQGTARITKVKSVTGEVFNARLNNFLHQLFFVPKDTQDTGVEKEKTCL